MSKLSRKAILAVLSLVLTFVALGATTFAWFSLGTTATVSPFDLNVRGSEGLEIQFGGYVNDGTTTGEDTQWFSTLNSDRMNGWLTGETGIFKDGKLEAVTSANGTTFQKLAGITDNEDENNTGTVTYDTTAPIANKDYVEFVLNFRTQTQGSTLNITDVIFTSNEHTWDADVDFTPENGTPVSADAEITNLFVHNAARMSVTGGSTTTIFQVNSSDTDGVNIGLDFAKGAHNYVAVKHGLDSLTNPGDLGYVESANATGEEDNIVSFSEEATGGYYTASVTIRVWIEGWDGNAYDALFDRKFSLSFKFELVTPTP